LIHFYKSCRMQTLRAVGLLVCLAAAVRAECNNYVENCNAETARMVRIACTQGEETCTCEGATQDQTINTQECSDEMKVLTFDALDTKDECEMQCKSTAEQEVPCKYYKFRLTSPPHSNMSYECLLMDADQCKGPGSLLCNHDHNCWSGGLECDDDLPNPPTPTQTPENAKDCNVSLASYTPGELHWYCLDNNNMPPTPIPVYETAEDVVEVPHSATCQTTHKCNQYSDSTNSILLYTCDGSGENGTWVSNSSNSAYDSEVFNGADRTTISKEPTCDADALPMKAGYYPQMGLELICSGESVEEGNATPWEVPAPNTCLLLCDYIHVLTIFTDWEDNEDPAAKVWWWEGPNGENRQTIENPENGEFVYCWEMPTTTTTTTTSASLQ